MVKDVLLKKGLREIKENIKQYITVIIIAILAVSLFTGIYANWQDFKYKVNHIYELSNMADGIVLTNSNNKEITNYLDTENVDYEERLYLNGIINSKNVLVATFNDNSTISKPAYMSVETLTSDMVLVDENFLIRNELEVGETFIFNIPEISLFNNSFTDVNLEFVISGTMTHPEALDNSEYLSSFIYIGEKAIAKSLCQYSNNLIGEDIVLSLLPSLYNQILIKSPNITNIIEYISSNYDNLFALTRPNLPSNLNIESDIDQAKKLLYIFPVIFYLVALLIILTSISELINKEQKNIGLLKALGYSNLEILAHYTNTFIILCIIGSIIGMIIGPLIIPPIMNQKYNILYQLPTISTPFFRPFYLISVILLIIIVYLTAILAIHNILKKVPASSIRGDNSYHMKETLFDRLPTKKDHFLTLKMALRNMKRKISRTLMVVFGVMGCSALLLCGFGIEDTLDNSINTELRLIPYDVGLSYNSNESKLVELMAIEEIKDVDEYNKTQVNILKSKMISSYLYILPENSKIFVPKYNEESCLISSKVAKEIGAKAGDQITFIYNQVAYEIIITEVIDISFSQGIFISSANGIIDLLPNNCWIRLYDETKQDLVLEKALKLDGINYGMTIDNLKLQAEDRLSSIRVMTNTVKIFAILLAIVVLYNLALLNFKERIKDIATLKVLGFTIKEIAFSFLLEIVILTVFASLIGLALGYPLMYAVLVINENPLLSYIYKIDSSSYIYTVLLTTVFGTIVNVIMSTFVRKVEMVESLKAVD